VEAAPPAAHASAGAVTRRLPIGADVQPGGGVHFRVWAPDRSAVAVVIGDRSTPLTREEGGYFSGLIADAGDGTRYQLRLDQQEKLLPDPASRFQPDGPHGVSQVIDASDFPWTDDEWRGCELKGQVLYEMHIGTFTPEGTWRAAAQHLDALRDIGITLLEIMPVAEFPGRFGWGYDGVDWFAPTRLYGTPDDFRTFVDRAHALGIGVILDVVYNHIGPDGNYLREFSRDYFSDRYENEWGDPLNFDGKNAHGMRELTVANAHYWIDEFHLDGYRLDATQQIFDDSEEHILAAITRATHLAAGDRHVLLMGENETQTARLMRPFDRGGYGLDALWNDDFHHSAVVALTGRREAYYTDYRGSAQEFLAAAKWGFLFQGQYYTWQKNPRGTPALDCAPPQFVLFLENHDQVANTARGQRMHQETSPKRYRAMTGLVLLMPGTPLLFQGQEFGSTKPFLFFADHPGQLGEDVRKGRCGFMLQFPSLSTPEAQAQLADPGDLETFRQCVLDPTERTPQNPMVRLHRDLLTLRRETAAFRAQAPRGLDGVIFNDNALALRFFAPDPDRAREDDRLVLLNLGHDLPINPISDPLLAPPDGQEWYIVWSSEDSDYGGQGTAPFVPSNWTLQGEALVVLAPRPHGPRPTTPAPAPQS
jgi:maltooligosyltrehalose trehalohydrolase